MWFVHSKIWIFTSEDPNFACPSTSAVRACLRVSTFLLCFRCSVYHIVDISEFISWSFVEAAAGRLAISSSEETQESLDLSADLRYVSLNKNVLCCSRSCCMNALFPFEPARNNLSPVIHCSTLDWSIETKKTLSHLFASSCYFSNEHTLPAWTTNDVNTTLKTSLENRKNNST